jgi:hypothetical protein
MMTPRMTQPPIEQLILANGTRGIEKIAHHLPPDYAARAARALYNSPRVLITTGFYVEGRPETDGPPGAFFLGRALAELGASVGYVGEPDVLAQLQAMVEKLAPQPLCRPDYIEFPVTDAATSTALAQEIVLTWQPSAVVAIERCGFTRSGCYRNVLGTDISRWTARLDDLFAHPGITTVAVGDGGNEIGMGLLAEPICSQLGITDPVQTTVDHLVLAAVSNWGAYGIIAYLSGLAGRDLLPAEGEDAKALEIMVAQGAIDGLTHRAEPSVDGFPPDTTSALIAVLRRLSHEL